MIAAALGWRIGALAGAAASLYLGFLYLAVSRANDDLKSQLTASQAETRRLTAALAITEGNVVTLRGSLDTSNEKTRQLEAAGRQREEAANTAITLLRGARDAAERRASEILNRPQSGLHLLDASDAIEAAIR